MNEKNAKKLARVLLGGTLIYAGISHLTFARKPFRAQVPDWVPLTKDDTVVYSGIAEITLGSSLVLTNEAHQQTVGKVAAAFLRPFSPATFLSMSITDPPLVWIPTGNDSSAYFFNPYSFIGL